MPVREADKRRMAVTELEGRVTSWEKHLRDADWIEELEQHHLWKKLCATVREEIQPMRDELIGLKDKLCRQPMFPQEAAKIREMVMVQEAALEQVDNLLMFPTKERKRLTKIQQDLPGEQARLEELKKQEGVHHNA